MPIRHLSVMDATALGCAFLTGLQVGFWKNMEEVQSLIHEEETFYPRISPSFRRDLLDSWHQFLKDNGIISD